MPKHPVINSACQDVDSYTGKHTYLYVNYVSTFKLLLSGELPMKEKLLDLVGAERFADFHPFYLRAPFPRGFALRESGLKPVYITA